MSIYFGHTTVNPPGDTSCSCFMVEQIQLPFVWWYSSWPLTPGFALLFARQGLCGVTCLCLPACGHTCCWPETHSVWTVDFCWVNLTTGSGACSYEAPGPGKGQLRWPPVWAILLGQSWETAVIYTASQACCRNAWNIRKNVFICSMLNIK